MTKNLSPDARSEQPPWLLRELTKTSTSTQRSAGCRTQAVGDLGNAPCSLCLKQPVSGQRPSLLFKSISQAIYFSLSNHCLISRSPAAIRSRAVT